MKQTNCSKKTSQTIVEFFLFSLEYYIVFFTFCANKLLKILLIREISIVFFLASRGRYFALMQYKSAEELHS